MKTETDLWIRDSWEAAVTRNRQLATDRRLLLTCSLLLAALTSAISAQEPCDLLILNGPVVGGTRATYDDPHQLSEGMIHVLANGELVIEDERLTDAQPGMVLSRGATR